MQPSPSFATLRRFLPYLWPAGEPALRARVVISLILVLIAKATILIMPFAYKGAIDELAKGVDAAIALAVGLVVAYAGARFGGVFFDNARNAIFEQLACDAVRHGGGGRTARGRTCRSGRLPAAHRIRGPSCHAKSGRRLLRVGGPGTGGGGGRVG